MGKTYRGRSIGVHVYLKGRKRWIGSVTEACEACDGLPKMCRLCQAKADLAAQELETRAKRALVYRTETCREFADRWTRDFNPKGTRWDASTVRHYEAILPNFTRQFGSVPMRDVDPASARSWAQTQPLGYVRAVRAMFNDAYRDELVDRNPFEKLRLDPAPGRSQIVAITEDELHLLCEAALIEHGKHGPTLAAMIAVAGYTGIRPAELYAIEPHDVRGDELDIRYQFNGHELKRPKSKKPRTVVLPRETAPYLAALPSYLGGVRVTRADGERVQIRPAFRNKNSQLYRQSAFSVTWAPIRARFEAALDAERARELRDARGGKPFHMYELRHLAATMILRKGGTLDDAAHQLGHANTKLIESVYGHLEDHYRLDRIKAIYGQNVKPLQAVDDESEVADG